MTKELTAIDVTNAPELLRLAEEVRRSGQARVLRRDSEDLAMLVPVAHPKKRRGRTKGYSKEDDDAFLASAGGWKGNVDVERFLADNYESRRRSTHPSVDL